MLTLEGRGEDWALTPDQQLLFVSMPAANKVAIANTRKWEVLRSVATGPHPRRVVLTEKLWVAEDEGLTAIDPTTFAATRIRFGAARELAISGDGDFVFAATDGAIAIIDARAQKLVARVHVNGNPASLAYSSAAKLVYAVDRKTGQIFAINPKSRSLAATIAARPGASQLRFAPNGRHALIANPEQNVVQVLDAATNRIVQNAEISDAPDQITFTGLLAYVRRRTSETILMIPLKQLGAEGKPLNVADFPGGQHAYGDGAASIADSIVPSPEGPSVLVANPADKMIYLYKEGMAAPAGGFSTYGRQPRATLVVDRSLRERAPGEYATTAGIGRPGTYDVVFFLDSPRVVACFGLEVANKDDTPAKPWTRVTAVAPPDSLAAGVPARIHFALTDVTGHEKHRAADVRVLVLEAPGIWQQRGEATPLADGTYEPRFRPAQRWHLLRLG